VDRLAISSQSPFRVVGENSPIEYQGGRGFPSPGIISGCLEELILRRFGCPDEVQVGWDVSEVQTAFVTTLQRKLDPKTLPVFRVLILALSTS
jgi:hypothetical protein